MDSSSHLERILLPERSNLFESHWSNQWLTNFSYRIDLHPSSGGDNYIDVSSLPFQIPFGALIPRRVENLLAASKNLGVTHITNGCYRLHPVEWNIGESAGCIASHAIRTKHPPRHIRNTEKLLKEFQTSIQSQGIEIAWPKITPR